MNGFVRIVKSRFWTSKKQKFRYRGLAVQLGRRVSTCTSRQMTMYEIPKAACVPRSRIIDAMYFRVTLNGVNF